YAFFPRLFGYQGYHQDISLYGSPRILKSKEIYISRGGWLLMMGTTVKLFFLPPILLGFCLSVVIAQWQEQTIKTNADFRSLCGVSPKVAWVSGTKGTYGRTIDAGKAWTVGTVPGAEKLDFRDVEAFG